jgi:hypothetical protein
MAKRRIRDEGYIHDSPEQIQRCLNCTAPPDRCSRCVGDGGHDRPYQMHTQDERLGAIRLMKEGLNPPTVAKMMGLNSQTVYYWQRMARKKGEL